MGVLQSQLFTQGDPTIVKKLEDCATGTPNEVTSHFKKGHPTNGRGEQVRRVQQALKNVQAQRPEFGIPDFDVNGIYDDKFEKAIAVYKTRRDIRNYANQIDNVVGKKTIISLDIDNKLRPHIPPTPKPNKPNEFPRPIPNCVPDADCPVSKEFDVTMLMGVSGGEIVEVSKYFFTIRDTTNGLSALYLWRGGGVGIPTPAPVSPAFAGEPSHITLKPDPVRVTRFGPAALLGAYTHIGNLSIAIMSVSYRPDDKKGLPQSPMFRIDTGPISVPGGNIHGGHFKILTTCRGTPGATRRVLGLSDVGPTE